MNLLSAKRGGDWSQRFLHTNETASAGYYAVKFPEQQITAELTASELVGAHRYSFPASSAAAPAQIVVDLTAFAEGDETTEALLEQRSKTLLVGARMSSGVLKRQQVFFAMEFSKEFTTIWNCGNLK